MTNKIRYAMLSCGTIDADGGSGIGFSGVVAEAGQDTEDDDQISLF